MSVFLFHLLSWCLSVETPCLRLEPFSGGNHLDVAYTPAVQQTTKTAIICARFLSERGRANSTVRALSPSPFSPQSNGLLFFLSTPRLRSKKEPFFPWVSSLPCTPPHLVCYMAFMACNMIPLLVYFLWISGSFWSTFLSFHLTLLECCSFDRKVIKSFQSLISGLFTKEPSN